MSIARRTGGFLAVLFFLGLTSARAQAGIYVGLQAGVSSQTAKYEDFEFNKDTSFVYGFRAGVRFLMLAAELSYIQAAHNLDPQDVTLSMWKDREVDWNFIGVNLKFLFPILILTPYLTVGYGHYSADIKDIGEDQSGGFNLGAGVELSLGKKLSLMAEAKYHRAVLDILAGDFKATNFTLTGGLNFGF